MSVTEMGLRQGQLFLPVSLSEELLRDPVGPLAVGGPRLSRVGDVSRVQEETHYLGTMLLRQLGHTVVGK